MAYISQRDSFWSKVYEKARTDKDIVVISADMGAPALDRFRRHLGSQFVNVGIAEQNAITLAAGLALAGKKPFAYAIAPFITLRCLEQIRVEAAIMHIPITLVGVGAGFSYIESGPTHHLVEDLAIMRAMPNINIRSITDAVMAQYFAEQCCKEKSTVDYIRLDRGIFPDIYNKNSDFSQGLAVLKESSQYYLISTGSMTHEALRISDSLAKAKLKIGVIDLFSLPVNEPALLLKVAKAKKLITLEEHFLPGGLGSAVCEALNNAGLSIPVKRIGLPMEKKYCYKYGGRDIIRRYYGIDSESVKSNIKKFILHK
jgi:transketolase